MKHTALLLALLVASCLGCAHAPSAEQQRPVDSGIQARIEQQFKASGQQIQRDRQEAENTMLAALAPAHRQLLAHIVGDLATNPNADAATAVRRLDAALIPGEKQAVLSASDTLRHSYFDEMKKLEQASRAGRVNQVYGVPESSNNQRDAGATLLLTVISQASWRTSMAVRSLRDQLPFYL
ncbi:MAG: hypothetical protein JOZ91_00345 [Candidatus Eremiobacteraeota bacterium]|nr:hypothetical protein [Candidatus Eremiobacteraeota bacterium]